MTQKFPLNPTQEAMLLHHLAGGERGVDVEQMICVLPEEVDAGAMTRAWQATVDRHQALRLSFDWSASPAQQVVNAPWSVELPITDWRGMSSDDQNRRLRSFLQEDRRRGFALGKSPLVRLALFRMGDRDYQLVWTFHHAILDGRSFTLLLEEIFARYDSLTAGGEPLAPAANPPPFAAYISWLVSNRDEGAERRFWTDKLAGFTSPTPITVAPAGGAAPAAAAGAEHHGSVETRLSRESTDRLRELAESCDVTIGTLVQAAWALLLHRYSGQDDVLFGTTRACRHVPVEAARETIGVFINTLPLRVQIDATASVREFLQNVRERFVDVRPFEHTPLANVHAWSAVTHGAPLFESALVFENYDLTESFQARGGRWTRRAFRLHEQTNFAVTLYGYAGTRLRLKVSFAYERLSPAAARRLLGHLRTILTSLTEDPDRKVADVALLTAEENNQLITEWNDTGTPFPDDTCTHAMIEAQAAPDRSTTPGAGA